MATSAKMGPQDMPPPGGYGPIQYERIKLRKFFTAPLTLGLLFAGHVIGVYVYAKTYHRIKNEQIELKSARFALIPMILAERDRAYLKQVRKNRDEERELMKNDPDWEVGTYYGEPIYLTRPPEEFREQKFAEFFAHSSWSDTIVWRMMRRHMF